MPHIMLDRPGVMAVIGQLEATPMTEHVRMDRKGDAGLLPCPRHQLAHRGGGQRPLTLGDEDVGCLRIVALELPQGTDLGPSSTGVSNPPRSSGVPHAAIPD